MEAIASNTYLTRLSPPFKNLNSRKGRFVKAKSFFSQRTVWIHSNAHGAGALPCIAHSLLLLA